MSVCSEAKKVRRDRLLRRGGILVGVAAGTAMAGASVVADRRVRAQRAQAAAARSRFDAPKPVRAGYARADDGVRLYYEEDGPAAAELTVVLAHGFSLNRHDLLFQRRALLDRFGAAIRIISFDQRSHGRSSRSSREHASIDQLGADLAAVLAQRAPAGPVVLIGHSLGGMTVLALADAHRELFAERIVGVALLSTSTGKLAALTLGTPAALARISDPVARLAVKGLGAQSRWVEQGRARLTDIAWVFTRRLAFGPNADPGLVEFVADMIGATPVDVIADFYPSLIAHDKLAALDVLIDLPVVIACGEDDVITPPEHSHEMADLLPKARLLLVPDTGHQAHMERPDVVNPPLLRLVEDALDEHRASRTAGPA